MQLTATIPEILSLSAPAKPVILAGASLQFPVAAYVQSGAVPGNNVVQIARAFRLRGATPIRGARHQSLAELAHDMPLRERALFSALPVPFASSARRFFERLVDLPEALRSTDRAYCFDWACVALAEEAVFGRSRLAAGPGPVSRPKTASR